MTFQQAALEKLDQYFAPVGSRPGGCVFFYRFTVVSPEITAFVKKYYEAARSSGAVIDGRLPNPNVNQLAYYEEMMGRECRLGQRVFALAVGRWLPRMAAGPREALAQALFVTLQELKLSGKNDNMLRNAYIKYMCWLYYRFEHMANRLGAAELPKILYCGSISSYELQLLAVLSRVGADVVLLEPAGDGAYAKADPEGRYSRLYPPAGLAEPPADFSLRQIQAELSRERSRQRLYGPPPNIAPCTNAWLAKPQVAGILTKPAARGDNNFDNRRFFYNSFIAQYGVEDKLTYSSELFDLYRQLRRDKRRLCVVNGAIPVPTPEEIAAVRRRCYTEAEHLASDLAQNLQAAEQDLQRLLRKAFMDIVLEAADAPGATLPKLTNGAVYLLCWLRRYQQELFGGWQAPEVGVFILFGAAVTDHEARFLRLLARLPVDVVLLQPERQAERRLADDCLLELKYEFDLNIEAFPTEQAQVRVSTAAYQAERDLDSLMYQDSGLYRNHQYGKAESVTLKAMYEEIAILWDQELKYRPSFQAAEGIVTMPVLLEKICGVRSGDVRQYWLDIKRLITPDTLVVRQLPCLDRQQENPMRHDVTRFLRSGRLQRNVIKGHKDYAYGILRADIQEHLLDKLQLLLDQRLIRGTFQNGTEYTVISVALNLPKQLLRLIQKFDFTKKNPKLIVINTKEELLSLEDSILFAYLNLVGFDILFFVPTGYQCIERHFRQPFANEQQLGEYLYDLSPPDFSQIQDRGRRRIGNPIRRLFGKE